MIQFLYFQIFVIFGWKKEDTIAKNEVNDKKTSNGGQTAIRNTED
jgi:hypothetical protein